ncbi:MAG: glycine cleavage system protein H [Methanosarcinales archaeon]|nr:glycine cleavage system protein H [Methanosarcinales archaeon]
MMVEDFEFPDDRLYQKNHVWILEGNPVTIGVTQLGQSLSKEIVHIDLPDEGENVKAHDLLIAYETIKAVSQISLPFDCVVDEVNDELWDKPNKINEDPYKIWMVKVRGEIDREALMDVGAACTFFGDLIKKERERYAGY